MNDIIIKRANKIKKKKKLVKIIKLSLLVSILALLLSYFVIGLIYNNGNFTITLDKNLYMQNNLIIYDNVDYKVFRSELNAEPVEYLDNMSSRWLPNNLYDHQGGSHNGDNYIAYTFYIENMGEEVTDYWSEVIIDDVIRDIDEAIRIRVYKNDSFVTYAKLGRNGAVERDTVAFEDDTHVGLDHVENFMPGDIIKYTIVIWLEGNDPECTDNLLGGEIKLHMEFNSEFKENKDK